MLRQPSVSVSAHRQSLLAERARSMRMQMTRSEAALWQAVRGKRLGVAFRRQVVIGGKFIADFAAVREKLIVEVDGGYHAFRCSADEARDAKLRRMGWCVVRIRAEVAIQNLPDAIAAIRDAIGAGGS